MRKLLFIDLYFHSKTSSSNFLLELLSKEYEIEQYFEDEDGLFQGKILPPIKNKKYDLIIFWQKKKSLKHIIKNVKANSYCFFPMFDDSPLFDWNSRYSILYWQQIKNFRIICFCKTLYDNLAKVGFDVHYYKYFPTPIATDNSGAEDAVYLWRRTHDVGLNIIEEINKNYPLSSVHCHNVPDPCLEKEKMIIPESLQTITSISSWYAQKQDMNNDIERCAIYMAPRLKEGIGMSFLEAMAMGRCVIAHDSPTMNEYIENGKTGILYDINKPKISLTKELVRVIQHQSRKYINEGYLEWQKNRIVLCDSLQKSIGFHGKTLDYCLLEWYRFKYNIDRQKRIILGFARKYMPEVLQKFCFSILRRPYHHSSDN